MSGLQHRDAGVAAHEADHAAMNAAAEAQGVDQIAIDTRRVEARAAANDQMRDALAQVFVDELDSGGVGEFWCVLLVERDALGCSGERSGRGAVEGFGGISRNNRVAVLNLGTAHQAGEQRALALFQKWRNELEEEGLKIVRRDSGGDRVHIHWCGR